MCVITYTNSDYTCSVLDKSADYGRSCTLTVATCKHTIYTDCCSTCSEAPRKSLAVPSTVSPFHLK